jgi:hypothetical protein
MRFAAMEGALARLKAWLVVNASPLCELLNPPATDADIAAFEARTSLTVPAELRCLYAIHNGEADQSDGIFGCQRWLPLKVVAEEVDLIGSTNIIPFMRSGGGDLLYVKDNTSSEADKRIYEWLHEEPEEAEIVAECLEAWLDHFVERLESGGYVYRPEELAALIDRRELGEE